MKYIICNKKQKKFFELFISNLDDEFKDGFDFICSMDELYSTFPNSSSDSDLIIIEVSLDWNNRLLQEFYGVDVAAMLRRDFLSKNPIIFFSQLEKNIFEKYSENESQFKLLNSKGSGFFSYPFSFERVQELFSKTKSLTDVALNEIVINNCGLKKEWERVSHKIGGLLLDNERNHSEIKILVERWGKSIIRFAPDQKENLGKFQDLLALPVESVNVNQLKQAKQNLDEGLKGKKPYFSDFSEIDLENLPKFPPKDYSEILIADDEPLDSLISGLQSEYRYTIVGQAQGAKEAERLLNEKKSNVVLSDYYFKKYTHDETTDKKIGEDFMRLAIRTNVGSANQPRNPIVAVISKTTLDKFDIPAGVLDFSGSSNATNPEFVHRGIWVEAIKRGVTEPQIIEGQKWSLEYHCRQRLEPYELDLPKLIRQWDSFQITVQETLNMIRNIPATEKAEDSGLIKSIKKTLEPFEEAEGFSLDEVIDIFVKIEKDHKKAKDSPKSETKVLIRNILHGKIEQFSCVTNHIKFARKVFSEVSSDLISLPEFKQIGTEFRAVLDNFKGSMPLTPFLLSLAEEVKKILRRLPEIPKIKNSFKAKNSVIKKIHILIAEDDISWSETVISAIKKVRSKLGDNFQITYKHFDNVSEALISVPKLSQTPAKKKSEETFKTIAIVDICMPRKKGKGLIPKPENGVELIQSLSKYTSNIPLIVFSTKASLDDRQFIGKLGIPDRNFIAKDFDAESAIMQSLISILEKKDKFIINRLPYERNGDTFYDFLINGLHIPFTKELNTTFQALYELRESGDMNNKLLFTAEEIYLKRTQIRDDETSSKKGDNNPIHDHINRIRELIHDTFRVNNRYIDIRELIKTKVDKKEQFRYELNAALPSIEDEEYIQEDYENFRSRNYKVLVIGENAENNNQIINVVQRMEDEGKQFKASEDLEQIVKTFSPDIICTELEQIELWKRIKTILPGERLGIIVTTTNAEVSKNRLIETAIKSGVPITNFVSINETDWVNSFLLRLSNEKQRVFLGEIADTSQNIKEPLVEILDESDLEKGILRLQINGESFTMNRSDQSKIIALLLLNPKSLVSIEQIVKFIEKPELLLPDNAENLKNAVKNWTKRIREKIHDMWLKLDESDETKELDENILQSSSKGLCLNVQIIDSRKS